MMAQQFGILNMAMRSAVIISSITSTTVAQYSIESETINSGGGQSGSASYSIKSSLGGIGGVSDTGSPVVVLRSGYMGQLYEILNVDVTSSLDLVNEGDSSQLLAVVNLDDGSVIIPAGSSVDWSVVSGPVNTPSAGGEVSTQAVYENEVATLGGTYRGEYDTTVLTVVDLDPDNYQSYGLDGIDDDWQVLHFGEPPEPEAGPWENPDRDANDNMMEFLTGFDPTDPNQWFQLTITGKSGSVATLVLNKVIPGRTYTVQAGTDLETFPDTIETLNPAAEDFEKVVTDSAAVEVRKFYRVDVTKP